MSEFRPIDGPIRILLWKPGHVVAVNRLGIFLAGGRECALRPMADAFNATKEWEGEEEQSKVTACPSCGYPIEQEGAEKCVSCSTPAPEAVVVVEEKKKEKSQLEEWF